jgi:hypothetical protein
MSRAKKWTFMVYLAGDNNLDTAGVADLKEMKRVGTTDDVNVVAQFDNGADHRTRRYLLRKGTSLAADQLKDLGPTNCGDPAVLEAFATWAITAYPADRYALVVWNHGNGWDDEDVYRLASKSLGMTVTRRGAPIGDGSRRRLGIDHARRITHSPLRRALFRTSVHGAIKIRGIAYDDDAKDFLDNQELKGVLKRVTGALGRPLDVLGMDACLMSMVEVLYEFRETAMVSVASEQTEPGDGWPYDTILRAVAAKPAMSAAQVGATIVQKYIASYKAGDNVTQAACDLSKCEALRETIDALGHTLLSHLAVPAVHVAVLQARKDVQSFERDDYVDLRDFCAVLAASCSEPAVVSACGRAQEAVRDFVIATAAKGADVQNAHGASIYFPRKRISTLYGKLDLASRTKWDDFLELYLRPGLPRGAGFR